MEVIGCVASSPLYPLGATISKLLRENRREALLPARSVRRLKTLIRRPPDGCHRLCCFLPSYPLHHMDKSRLSVPPTLRKGRCFKLFVSTCHHVGFEIRDFFRPEGVGILLLENRREHAQATHFDQRPFPRPPSYTRILYTHILYTHIYPSTMLAVGVLDRLSPQSVKRNT